MSGALLLTVRQKSALNGFRFEFLDPAGAVVGGFEYANFAQAKNARLKVHEPGSRQGEIALDLGGHRAYVAFEYLRRGWTNDIRYTLEQGPTSATPGDGVEPLATADVVFEEGRRLPRILLKHPFAAEVLPSDGLLKKRFSVVSPGGVELGEVREPRAVSLRRVLEVSLAANSSHRPEDRTGFLQAFLAVVVLCVRY